MTYKVLKYFIIIISAIGLGYLLSRIIVSSNKEPELQFLNGVVKKYGTIKIGDEASHFFKLKNIGESDLKILNVSTRCGCTVPSWNTRPIPPNSEDSIQVIYDTNIVGPFNQSIEIFTNTRKGSSIVHILGIVKD